MFFLRGSGRLLTQLSVYMSCTFVTDVEAAVTLNQLRAHLIHDSACVEHDDISVDVSRALPCGFRKPSPAPEAQSECRSQKLRICVDVAKAMKYLHERPPQL